MDFLGKILSADDLINKQYVDEAIPTTLPASDVYAWAKASTKPSYTKSEVGLGNVDNKSSATIREEITATNVTNALGYTPVNNASLADYLLKSGGTITGKGASLFTINRTDGNPIIAFQNNGTLLGYLGINTNGEPVFSTPEGNASFFVHSGNIGSQTVAKANELYSPNGTGYARVYDNTQTLSFGIGHYGNYIDGSTINFRYGNSYTTAMFINALGNVGIGTTDPKYKLDVNGTVRISGAVTMLSTLSVTNGINITTAGTTDNPLGYQQDGTIILRYNGNTYGNTILSGGGTMYLRPNGTTSTTGEFTIDTSGTTTINGNAVIKGDTATGSDIRFKDKLFDHRIVLSDIANAPLFTFRWNDREDDTIHLGSSAQYWEKVAPWLVKGEDFKTLNYSTLGVAIGISLANKMVNHEERIKILEKENKALKEEIRRIQYGS